MKIRIHAVVLATAMGLSGLSPASAFMDDTRPPPNGMNGLSANGLSANGLAANGLSTNERSMTDYIVGDATIRAVVLSDGTRAELR